jgi:serine/threonine-protein kinase
MDQRQTGETAGDRHAHWAPIERYQPCFELATGGMATVYLARVTARAGFDRFVALKRIHPHLVKEPGFIEMFLDEARVASQIVHPNVCSVFDYEALGDCHYIAMEYLMGEPLSRVSHAMQGQTEAPSAERTAYLVARIIADACEGLHAAHELRDSEGEPLNVVHRDVSPQNLFLTYDGAVKVVDFGLVRTAQCLHKTKTGIVKGKFGYLAPEAVSSKAVDRRADVWALGVVLWELVTQQRLFLRDSEADTILAVASADVPPPSTVRPGVPAGLDPIVLKALARDPAERYATARALGRDLIRFIHGGTEPVGLSDIAEWMDRLFPGGRARKLQLLEMAGQVGIDLPTIVAPRAFQAPILPPRAEFSVAETRALSSIRPLASDEPSSPRPDRRYRWPATATTGLVALAVTAGSLGMTFLSTRSANNVAASRETARAVANASPVEQDEQSLPVRGGQVLSPPPDRTPALELVQQASSCSPDRGTYVLEVVPASDGDARRMVLRAIPRETAPSARP